MFNNWCTSDVGDFNFAISTDEILCLCTYNSTKKKLSCKLDIHMFNLLLESAARACLLSVASSHASAWLSVATRWLGLDTYSHSALCPGSALDSFGHNAITCKRGGDKVARHNTFCVVLAKHVIKPVCNVQVEADNDITSVCSHTHPASLLVTKWV